MSGSMSKRAVPPGQRTSCSARSTCASRACATMALGDDDPDHAAGRRVVLDARDDVGGDQARDLTANLGHDRARERIGGEARQARRDGRLGRRVAELVEQRGDGRGVVGGGVADGQSAVVTGPRRSRSRS